MIKNYHKQNYLLFILSFSALLFSNCSSDDDSNADSGENNLELVWSDEFDGEAGMLPDTSKWTYDIGRGINGWGNQELQYYTKRPENVSLDGNGFLNIVARREPFAGAAFTSARIKTQGIFDQTYGRFEFRAKTPFGPGVWPALWMLGSDIDEVNWPNCGEIDVMELRGQEPQIIHGSVHGPGYSAGNAVTNSFRLSNDRFDTAYRVFAIEWQESSIKFYMDDNLYHTVTPSNVSGEWVFDKPFFIILNIAVGGSFVGFPSSQTSFPQTLSLDYIRVYKFR